LDENLLVNFLYFIGSIGLLLTVGWMAFAFVGKIQFDGKYFLARGKSPSKEEAINELKRIGLLQ
jgi:hypothetical protein